MAGAAERFHRPATLFVSTKGTAMNNNTSSIHPVKKYDLQRLLDQQRERIDRQWELAIARYIKAVRRKLDRFLADTEAIDEHDLEGEEFGPVFAQFNALCRMGVKFDRSFVQRIAELRQQARYTDIDIDMDPQDDRLEDGFGSRFAGSPYQAMTAENEGA
jgi:hypothetical protein